MKKFILIIFATVILTKSYSQMNKKKFFDIDFFILTKNEKKIILNNKADFTLRVEKGDNIYTLNDGRIIYEMLDVKTYLFNNITDFNYFESKCIEIANEETKSKTEVKDLKFIEKRFLYIDFFKQAYGIDFNLNDLKSIKTIDDLLNSLNKEDILKYKLSIIAVIGELIILNSDSKDGKWKDFQIKKDIFTPMIFVKGSVIDPVKIFDNEFYEKYEKGKKISILNSVKQYIESL